MQLVLLCVYIHISFEDTFENSQWGMSGKCNPCNFASSQATHVRRHLKTHSGKTTNKCDQCDFAFAQVGHLRRHLKTHSGKKSQINVNSVSLHLVRQAIWTDIWKHSGEKSNKCNKCDFASAQADNLRIHVIMNPQISRISHMHCICLIFLTTEEKSQINATYATFLFSWPGNLK